MQSVTRAFLQQEQQNDSSDLLDRKLKIGFEVFCSWIVSKRNPCRRACRDDEVSRRNLESRISIEAWPRHDSGFSPAKLGLQNHDVGDSRRIHTPRRLM